MSVKGGPPEVVTLLTLLLTRPPSLPLSLSPIVTKLEAHRLEEAGRFLRAVTDDGNVIV